MKRPTLTARISGLEADVARAERDRSEAVASWRVASNDAHAKQKQIDDLERQLTEERRMGASFALELLRKYDTTDAEHCNTCHPELNQTARYRQCVPHMAMAYLMPRERVR